MTTICNAMKVFVNKAVDVRLGVFKQHGFTEEELVIAEKYIRLATADALPEYNGISEEDKAVVVKMSQTDVGDIAAVSSCTAMSNEETDVLLRNFLDAHGYSAEDAQCIMDHQYSSVDTLNALPQDKKTLLMCFDSLLRSVLEELRPTTAQPE